MTWLPISLKNAAKCDKWYELQNHSITESLNAKGAREKPVQGHPRACRFSVSNKNPNPPAFPARGRACDQKSLGLSPVCNTIGAARWLPANREHPFHVGKFEEELQRKTHGLRCQKTQPRASLYALSAAFGACFKPSKPHNHNNSFTKRLTPFLVTDLRAAGSPAELKHITQRRKRKQP